MATAETNIVHTIILDVQKVGVTVFKNVRGVFFALDKIRRVSAGLLFPGASDLVGWTCVEITPEMVGQTVAIFTAFEAKTATGKPSKEQENFIEIVRKAGGYAGVARSSDDAKRIVS